MAVGINGLLGKPMIREEKGFHIQIRRSLRDVFRRVPTVNVDVRVNIHAILTSVAVCICFFFCYIFQSVN